MKRTTPEAAVSVIQSGNRVFIHSVAGAPLRLVDEMTARAPELRDVEIVHLHTEGPAPYAAPDMQGSFRVNALFVGANVNRELVGVWIALANAVERYDGHLALISRLPRSCPAVRA